MSVVDAGYFLGNTYSRIKFWSNDYFLDHQILRVTISSLQNELENTLRINPSNLITFSQDRAIEQWMEKKRAEVDEFYRLKGDIVIIMNQWPIVRYRNDRSNETTIDFLEIFCGSELEIECFPNVGSTLIAKPTFQALLAKSQAKYHHTLKTNVNVLALATTVKTTNLISFVTKIGNGRLLLLNDLDFNINGIPNFDEWFMSEIGQIFGLLNEDLEEIAQSAPEWVRSVELEAHKKIETKLELLTNKKLEIESEIEENKRQY